MASSPLASVRALHAALEAGQHGEELRQYFTADASTIEHPNLVRPRGGALSLEQIVADSNAGAQLLTEQHYSVRSAVEVEDTAILRLTWTGVVARDVGPFRAGQVLKAHIAQFIKTREGRIAQIETFDCYEPFS